MTKHELARQIATDPGITAAQAASILDAAFDVIAGELTAGRDVAIAGRQDQRDRSAARERGDGVRACAGVALQRAQAAVPGF